MAPEPNLPVKAPPTASQGAVVATGLQLSTIAYAAAITFTVSNSTSPNTEWNGKIAISPYQAATFTWTAQVARQLEVVRPHSWLSTLAKRIRDKIPAEEWAKMPERSSHDIDREIYGN